MGFSCDPMTVSSCCVHFPLHSVGWTLSPSPGRHVSAWKLWPTRFTLFLISSVYLMSLYQSLQVSQDHHGSSDQMWTSRQNTQPLQTNLMGWLRVCVLVFMCWCVWTQRGIPHCGVLTSAAGPCRAGMWYSLLHKCFGPSKQSFPNAPLHRGSAIIKWLHQGSIAFFNHYLWLKPQKPPSSLCAAEKASPHVLCGGGSWAPRRAKLLQHCIMSPAEWVQYAALWLQHTWLCTAGGHANRSAKDGMGDARKHVQHPWWGSARCSRERKLGTGGRIVPNWCLLW